MSRLFYCIFHTRCSLQSQSCFYNDPNCKVAIKPWHSLNPVNKVCSSFSWTQVDPGLSDPLVLINMWNNYYDLLELLCVPIMVSSSSYEKTKYLLHLKKLESIFFCFSFIACLKKHIVSIKTLHTGPVHVLIRIINNNGDLNIKQTCTVFPHIVIDWYTGSGFTVLFNT